ncbi:hypothetical protein VKT23_016491 [Stygiomarasmius scandens]|uniref:YTH domain-containing protein n=1 Tax=Marasmiellus scandens TaxID=2682957 RepID=A0ABR1IYF0_9AGAR
MAGDGRRDPPMNRRQHNNNNQSRRPPQPASPPIHVVSPSPAGYHGPSPHYSQYGQRYMGPYTMSQQPTPMPPYAYHPFQGVPDGSMMPQNIHASYQFPPVYPYQRHSSDPIYPSSTSTPPISPQSGSQNTTPPYANPGQFQSLRYSPMSPQFAYPTQSYPASPVFPSQYPPPYPQHFTSSPDDGQGAWWYVPHPPSVPSRQYSGDSTYPTYQTINYSPVPHQEVEQSSYPSSSSQPQPQTQQQPIHSLSPPRPSNYPHTGIGPPTGSPSSPPPLSSPSLVPSPKPETSARQHAPEKPGVAVRRPYHPNPPAHRSEWVMWSGNVPSDATHDELWRFFNQSPPDADSNDPNATSTGVMSIFLISRSSCAFVNFESEAHLQAAINRFNGVPLRPHDPRCPRLVCRVRKKDDDLKAGVGGQRGVGMHTKWVRDLKGKKSKPSIAGGVESSDQSDLDDSSSAVTTPSISVLSESGASEDSSGRAMRRGSGERGTGSGSSYASTNSSLLTRHFPKRYFILKSLSQYDLDLSVQKGLWATQKHNEGILDQAFRTSKEVYLIFGVNKSGEFYGYAKMTGPVRQGEHRVSWASRTDSSASVTSSRSSRGGSLSPVTGRGSHNITEPIIEEESPVASPGRVLAQYGGLGGGVGSPPARNYFPAREHRLVEESPRPVSNLGDASPGQSILGVQSPRPSQSQGLSAHNVQSAPAELGHQHRQITMKTPTAKYSLDQNRPLITGKAQSIAGPGGTTSTSGSGPPHRDSALPPGFKLSEEAPLRARRRSDDSDHDGDRALKSVKEEEEPDSGKTNEDRDRDNDTVLPSDQADRPLATPEGWGESFRVEWICTERLPFYRTRHIRNPWNHDREVKVSRDGTELEPGVGQMLLDEWHKLAEEKEQGEGSTTTATTTTTPAAGSSTVVGPPSTRRAPPPPSSSSLTGNLAKGSRDR